MVFKKNYIQSFASYEFFSASPFLRIGPDRECRVRPTDELKRGKQPAPWNVTNLTQLVSRSKKYSTNLTAIFFKFLKLLFWYIVAVNSCLGILPIKTLNWILNKKFSEKSNVTKLSF